MMPQASGGLESAKIGASYHKVKIIAEEFFERGTKDFTSLLTRILAKKPDLIETGQTDPTSAALICKQVREQGYEGVLLLRGANPAQLVEIAGAHAEKAYMYLGGPIKPENDYQKRVYEAYDKKWGEASWDGVIWIAYGAVPSLTKAIVAAQSFEPEAIAKKLETIEFETPTGKLSFGGSKLYGTKRQLLYQGSFYQLREGVPVFLGDLDYPRDALD